MRIHARLRLLPVVVLIALAAGACAETTGPVALDADALEADLAGANNAVAAPAAVSFTAVGAEINTTLATLGGGSALVDLPAALVVNPRALIERAELRQRVHAEHGQAAVIPAAALGGTFEYSVAQERYVRGDRTGAPTNGVRFILYAVDPATRDIIVPLVETGYVDLTRSVSQQTAVARVEVYGGGANLVKVLDYAVTVSGTIVSPSVLVAGFAKHQADSLSFSLTSSFSLAQQTIAIDWRTALPSRNLTSRVEQTITGGQSPSVTIDGLLTSASGRVGISGTILQATGGTLTVTVNNRAFATITLSGAEDESPEILNANGEPLTEREAYLLRQILAWFEHAFDTYEDLLDPVEHLLDIAF